MRIAYVSGLEEVARTLTEFGHELMPIDVAKDCDAVLCFDALPKVDAAPGGALYLMAKEKSPEQINDQIKRRLYTELFGR